MLKLRNPTIFLQAIVSDSMDLTLSIKYGTTQLSERKTESGDLESGEEVKIANMSYLNLAKS